MAPPDEAVVVKLSDDDAPTVKLGLLNMRTPPAPTTNDTPAGVLLDEVNEILPADVTLKTPALVSDKTLPLVNVRPACAIIDTDVPP
jgi:hypothetical protein